MLLRGYVSICVDRILHINTVTLLIQAGWSTWYEFARYDAVGMYSIASAINEISGLDSAEVGHGTYCFDKMKRKRV